MTYRELYEKATRQLEKSEITLGEYEEITKPLDGEIRKKGKWVVEDSGNYNGKYSTCYCSNCKDYYTRAWREMNYCPNCGAEMESEE